MKKNHLILHMLALAGFALATPAHAVIVIYSEDFTGTGALHGTAPTTTTDGATWVASGWQKNGTITGSGNNNAFLPFAPESGWLYTLTATLSDGGGGWTALGFTEFNEVGEGFQGFDVNASPWVFYRGTTGSTPREVDSRTGPATGGGFSHGSYDSPVTLSMVLDTTGSDWSVEWFINGDSERTHTFTDGNPSINYVGFGRITSAVGPIQSFELTGIPEPGSLALLGAGVGLILLRRRRA